MLIGMHKSTKFNEQTRSTKTSNCEILQNIGYSEL